MGTTKPQTAPKDRVLAQATELAQKAAQEVARPGHVGPHLKSRADAPRLVTHYFECHHPGYVGWVWAVTVARAPRSKSITVCEVQMLPGKAALLAPPWVPWDERLLPSDVPRGEMVPYLASDDRLTAPDSPQAAPVGGEQTEAPNVPTEIKRRPRVINQETLKEAANRWQNRSRGARKGQRFPQSCATCAFLMILPAPLGDQVGVCANEFSTSDGQLVAYGHSCGAHSETDIDRLQSDWDVEPLRLNDLTMETYDPAEFWD